MNIHTRRRLAWLAGLVIAAGTLPAAAGAGPERVLIVVSGEGREQGAARPGFEMDEFAQAYAIFRDNGLTVDVASPAGGAVEADRFDPEVPYNARVLADESAMRQLADTRATASLDAADYAAVYVVGGKGAMFDLPADPALRSLLARVHELGGVVAAVCHGPAALVDVKLADGSYLVSGRTITGFSNEEESLFGKRWASEYPFLLEDRLRERGADWREALPMLPRVVVDRRLITGQNPYSTAGVAEAVVRAIGRSPAARKPSREEASMALVQRALAGEEASARAELAADPAAVHPELIGMLGYYQAKAAQNDATLRIALTIMKLAMPHMREPRLTLAVADAHWRLGDSAQARVLVTELLAIAPDMDEARQLLARINH